jgi:hypothetical protein
LAEWLGTGLQNPVHRFDSGRRLFSRPRIRIGRKLLARFHRIPATVTITLLGESPHTSIAAHTTIKRRKK